jgi:Tfp pilus assembly protein FimT
VRAVKTVLEAVFIIAVAAVAMMALPFFLVYWGTRRSR